MERKTIVILGGGYAGVIAANRIAGNAGRRARVILISDRDDLVHRVRLHEAVARGAYQRYPLAAMLRRPVERVRGRATRIDAAARVVEIDGGAATVGYDLLVYAIGSGVAAGAPGLGAAELALASPESALAFAARLRDLPDGAPVVVVGGGLSGIETAAEIAEAEPRLRVTILCDALMPAAGERGLAALREGLDELGVVVREGARVAAVEAGAVRLASGERVAAHATVWAAGFGVPGLARASGLPVDGAGRRLVDAQLRVPGHPEILGAGDAVTACVGRAAAPQRQACATALPMAAHVADVIVDELRGRAPRVFRFRYAGWCVSLGRRRGVVVLTDGDDRATGRVITGRVGAMLKELIARFPIASVRWERRIAGTYVWPGRFGRRRALPGEATRALPASDTRVA